MSNKYIFKENNQIMFSMDGMAFKNIPPNVVYLRKDNTEDDNRILLKSNINQIFIRKEDLNKGVIHE